MFVKHLACARCWSKQFSYTKFIYSSEKPYKVDAISISIKQTRKQRQGNSCNFKVIGKWLSQCKGGKGLQ